MDRMNIRQNTEGPIYDDSATAFMKGAGEEVLPLLLGWVNGVHGVLMNGVREVSFFWRAGKWARSS